MKRILSIDGGGIKGVFPAKILAELEEDIGKSLYKYFDLIAGTSTGGIIAIGLALGIPAKNILEFYEDAGPSIFSQKRKGWRGWLLKGCYNIKWASWGLKYSSKELKAAISKVFLKQTIGDAKTRLLIPAWNRITNEGYLYKTAHHERFSTDYKELASDVAMATAAAPTYFPEHITKNRVGLVDGGIWANNPASLAVVEGIGTLGWQKDEIRVLSIGCFDETTILKGTLGPIRLSFKSTGLFMAGQSHCSLSIARILTGDVGGATHKAIYRISPSVPEKRYSLDDTSKIPELAGRGFDEFRKQKPKILPVFFEKPVEPFKPLH